MICEYNYWTSCIKVNQKLLKSVFNGIQLLLNDAPISMVFIQYFANISNGMFDTIIDLKYIWTDSPIWRIWYNAKRKLIVRESKNRSGSKTWLQSQECLLAFLRPLENLPFFNYSDKIDDIFSYVGIYLLKYPAIPRKDWTCFRSEGRDKSNITLTLRPEGSTLPIPILWPINSSIAEPIWHLSLFNLTPASRIRLKTSNGWSLLCWRHPGV